MTVKELKEILNTIPDDYKVMIWNEMENIYENVDKGNFQIAGYQKGEFLAIY